MFALQSHSDLRGSDADSKDIKNPVKKDEKGEYEWTCRFCKKDNKSATLNFVHNNYKCAVEKNCMRHII